MNDNDLRKFSWREIGWVGVAIVAPAALVAVWGWVS